MMEQSPILFIHAVLCTWAQLFPAAVNDYVVTWVGEWMKYYIIAQIASARPRDSSYLFRECGRFP